MSSLSLYTDDDNEYSTLSFFKPSFDSFVIKKSNSKRKPYNVIFDLDNTLVCSVLFKELHLIPNDISLQYKDYIFDKENLGINYRIFLRPYLSNVLKEISKFLPPTASESSASAPIHWELRLCLMALSSMKQC